jgi:hypothetical protein
MTIMQQKSQNEKPCIHLSDVFALTQTQRDQGACLGGPVRLPHIGRYDCPKYVGSGQPMTMRRKADLATTSIEPRLPARTGRFNK